MPPRSWVLALPPLVACLLLLLACGGGGGGGTLPDGSGPYGLEERVLVGALGFPTGPADPTPLDRLRAFPNLGFTRPVSLTHAPDGTDRVFVVEQGGRIFVFPNQDSVASATTFLDISARVSRAGNEEGLLGLAFDPAYAETGRFWVHYSAASPRRSVVARFTVTADPDVADATSEQVVLEVPQPFENHNGGWLDFGPDGMLYLAFGDGGSADDPAGNGQDLDTLLGKVLRIDVRGTSTYAVPPDNPFAGQSGRRGEIWAYGARNPWRCSFDRDTGDLWLGDVGQGAREEVDLVTRGANLGWDVYEGTAPHENPGGLPPTAFTVPVVDYPRSAGTTVIGGVVYRGTAIPSLRGAYLYGDYGTGTVWALVRSGGTVLSNEVVASVPGVVSFGEDRDGEVYAVSLAGSVWRFREHDPSGDVPFPTTLSATGLFADVAALVPAPGLIEYEVIAPLWSDGARKRRWIALPGASRIGFDAGEAWGMPVGTVLVKHFEVDLSPSTVRRLETRVLIRGADGWTGFTYRWREDETEADLLPGAATDTFTVQDPTAPGGSRERTWSYPSRTDCLRCHTEAAGRVLGLRTPQMNRDFDYPATTDNQLRSWNHVGLFDRDVGPASAYPAHADPSDPSADLRARARSYLDANCAMCHRPGGPTPVDVDLRSSVPVGSMRLVGVRPTAGDLGLADAWRVLSGAKESSVLWERLRRLDDERMPPLASNLVDASALDLIGDWIDSGP